MGKPTVPKTCLVVEQDHRAESTAHIFFSTISIMLEPNRILHLNLAAFSGAVPSPFGHDDKYVIDDTHGLIRTQIQLCRNFPQIHPARDNVKKLSSDPLF